MLAIIQLIMAVLLVSLFVRKLRSLGSQSALFFSSEHHSPQQIQLFHFAYFGQPLYLNHRFEDVLGIQLKKKNNNDKKNTALKELTSFILT